MESHGVTLPHLAKTRTTADHCQPSSTSDSPTQPYTLYISLQALLSRPASLFEFGLLFCAKPALAQYQWPELCISPPILQSMILLTGTVRSRVRGNHGLPQGSSSPKNYDKVCTPPTESNPSHSRKISEGPQRPKRLHKGNPEKRKAAYKRAAVPSLQHAFS